jgi:hypothetical protein
VKVVRLTSSVRLSPATRPVPPLPGIVRQTLQLDPHLAVPFLHALGSVMSEATGRVLYRRLEVTLPELYAGGERGGGETPTEWKHSQRWQTVLK